MYSNVRFTSRSDYRIDCFYLIDSNSWLNWLIYQVNLPVGFFYLQTEWIKFYFINFYYSPVHLIWIHSFLQVNLSTSSSSSSLPSLDVSVSSGGGGGGGSASWQNSATPSKAGSLPRGTTPPHSVSPMRTPDFYVIRVSVSSPCKETEGINMYKSIMISNHEKTPQVIRNAMLKHSLEGNPDDFALAQLLPKSGNSGSRHSFHLKKKIYICIFISICQSSNLVPFALVVWNISILVFSKVLFLFDLMEHWSIPSFKTLEPYLFT